MDAMHAQGERPPPRPDGDLRLPGESPRPQPAPALGGLVHGLLLALLLVAPLLVAGLALLLEPDPRGHGTHEQLGLEPCEFLQLTGLPCPGCGVTTSLALLVRGRIGTALAVQPLGPVLALALCAAACWGLGRHLRGHDLAREFARLRWGWLASFACAAVLSAWAYKLAVG